MTTIDQAIGCQHCTRDLADSPSDDFCSERCQQDWHAARADDAVDSRVRIAGQPVTVEPGAPVNDAIRRAIALLGMVQPSGIATPGTLHFTEAMAKPLRLDVLGPFLGP